MPPVREAAWCRQPVDAFVLAGLEAEGLRPAPEAPRELLIRRLYLDLLGVPPDWSEWQAALGAAEPDWYERLVDRLLADPRHGERWGRHWMDIWRYSDWWGLGSQLRNSQKHMWHFRDWIVESLNADTPYDAMVRLMLAADEIAPADSSQLRATGFLARNWFLFNRNTWMEDAVEHVGKGFLGLTMNCAKCHDHKYDPLSQTDFYGLRAVFEPCHVRMDLVPGEVDLEKNGIPRVFDGVQDVPTYRFERGEESQPDKSRVIAPDVPTFLRENALKAEPVPLPEAATEPERQPWVLDTHLDAAKRRLEQAQKTFAQTGSAKPEARELAHLDLLWAESEWNSVQRRVEAIRVRWGGADPAVETAARTAAVRAEWEEALARAAHKVGVQRAALTQALPDKKAAAEKALKTAEADWEKARAQTEKEPGASDMFRPLPGAKWVPTRFLSSGKDDPEVRFPKASSGRRKALAEWITDGRNPLAARVAVNHIWGRHFGFFIAGTPFDLGRSGAAPTHPELLDWLASELVEHGWSMKHLHRVLVTSAVYRMSSSSRGREAELARDPDNRKIWRRVPVRLESEAIRDSVLALAGRMDWRRGGPSIPAGAQANSTRRSLYFFHSNNDRNLFLTTFDGAMVRECYRREQSVVPQQALAMINSALSGEAPRGIVVEVEKRLQSQGTDSDADFVRESFLYALGMRPDAAAVEASLQAFEEWKKSPAGNSPTAVREAFLWVLLNHNDFVTLR